MEKQGSGRAEGTMKRQFIIVALGLAAAIPGYGQSQDSHQSIFQQEAPKLLPKGRPVARVNGVVLADRDLLREMYTIFPYARQHNGAFPKAMEADIRKGALKMIEFEELVYQEAKHRGMTVEPIRLNKAEREFMKQFKNPEMYKVYLNEEAQGSKQVLRSKIERSLLIEDLLKTEVQNKAGVTLAETRAFYDQHPEKFRLPETYGVQTISMMAPAKATPQQLADAKKRAQEALKQAKAAKDYESFGVLAEKISEDDYRVMMGDHHVLDATRIPEPLLSAVKKMQPGEISEVIQVEQTFTILRLNARNPAGMQKFETMKESLRNQLKQNKVEQLRSSLNRRLRQSAKIEEL
jgi:peptidyl-prolyl cis-trans isomerase SurA